MRTSRTTPRAALTPSREGGPTLRLHELALVVVVPEVLAAHGGVLGAYQRDLGALQDARRNGGAAHDDEPRSTHLALKDALLLEVMRPSRRQQKTYGGSARVA